MRHQCSVIAIWVALAGPAVAVCAQQASKAPGQSQEGFKVAVEVDSVLLSVSVRDRRTNRSLANLGKDDFLVYEDNIPQKVDHASQGELPLSTLLLLDNSGSTADKLPFIRDAAVGFVTQQKKGDRVAVAVFNSLSEMLRDFTDDAELLERAIDRITPLGGTALYDALMTSLDLYLRGVEGRRAIVVFTDGVDQQLEGAGTEGSRTPFEVLFRKVQEAEPVIYPIFLAPQRTYAPPSRREAPRMPGGVGWPPIPGRRRNNPADSSPRGDVAGSARDQLLMIAEQTGGRLYSPRGAEDLSRIYSEIADDLKLQYQISYSPSHHGRDGKWHEIRVRLRNTEGAVRTRNGYVARSDSRDAPLR